MVLLPQSTYGCAFSHGLQVGGSTASIHGEAELVLGSVARPGAIVCGQPRCQGPQVLLLVGKSHFRVPGWACCWSWAKGRSGDGIHRQACCWGPEKGGVVPGVITQRQWH